MGEDARWWSWKEILIAGRWGDQDDPITPDEEHLAVPIDGSNQGLILGVRSELDHPDRLDHVREDHVHVTIVSVERAVQLAITS